MVKKIWIVWGVLGLVGIFVLFLILDLTGVFVWRYHLQLERAAIKKSHQYIEAKQSTLMQLYGEWLKGTEAQKLYLEQRMRLESSRIPQYEVPIEVLQIISRR